VIKSQSPDLRNISRNAQMHLSALFVSCSAAVVVSAGALEYEWAGIFAVSDTVYMWTAQKVEGAYADATMKMAVLPATDATAEALEALEEAGKRSLGSNCTPVVPGSVITPMTDACYQLVFDQDLWQSLYTINASGVAAAAFFTEHVPTEFENTAHYLKDRTGEDVEPLAELPKAAEKPGSVEWGPSLGAAAIINMITFVGVILLAPGLSKVVATNATLFDGLLSAFAAGSLLGCAFFLLLFEATHLVAESWEDEAAQTWRWGVMILAGFLLPAVIDCSTALMQEAWPTRLVAKDTIVTAFPGDETGVVPGAAPSDGETKRSPARLIGAVAIGDFFHNLCDGFFLGVAFKGCGNKFGWGVALASVLHELPQELADYAVLTGSGVGMTPARALLVNFLSGLSVMLGVVIINVTEVDNGVVGLLLAFGGGVYLHIAASECMPKVYQLKLSAKTHLLCLLAFVLGATFIGLILLDHKHCEPNGGSGHGHGH